MSTTVCITFPDTPADTQEVLIALLSDTGFDGFEQDGKVLKCYIPEETYQQTRLEELIQPFNITYSQSFIKAENWNAKWEADFEPVTVLYPGSSEIFANIRAHFHEPAPSAKYEIVITPKMSFGTGHHATTYGMVECMSKIDFRGKRVIDFGTGTGVLAILAEKMGASNITATDNDDWSIDNAAENIRLNDCKKIELIKAEGFSGTKADIILANINLNVILANLKMIREACEKDSRVIFSGMLTGDKQVISEALKKHFFHIENIYERNNWIVIVCNV